MKKLCFLEKKNNSDAKFNNASLNRNQFLS